MIVSVALNINRRTSERKNERITNGMVVVESEVHVINGGIEKTETNY